MRNTNMASVILDKEKHFIEFVCDTFIGSFVCPFVNSETCRTYEGAGLVNTQVVVVATIVCIVFAIYGTRIVHKYKCRRTHRRDPPAIPAARVGLPDAPVARDEGVPRAPAEQYAQPPRGEDSMEASLQEVSLISPVTATTTIAHFGEESVYCADTQRKITKKRKRINDFSSEERGEVLDDRLRPTTLQRHPGFVGNVSNYHPTYRKSSSGRYPRPALPT